MSDRPAPFGETAAGLLREGRPVRFRVEGTSMGSTIRPGDLLVVAPVGGARFRRGEILLYEGRWGPIAHRLVGIRRGPGGGSVLIFRGDGVTAGPEAVAPSRVLGRVVAVERGGRVLDMTQKGAMMRQRTLSTIVRVRHRLRRLLARPRLLPVAAALLLAAAPASAQMRLQTGSYTGDGADNRAITQVGFAPDVVIIKGRTTQNAQIRTATMSGDATKEMNGDTALQTNRIKSLYSGGFTLGTHASVNGSGVTY